MIDNKNLSLAVTLSVAILVGFELYFKNTRPQPQDPATAAQMQQPQAQPPAADQAVQPPSAPAGGAVAPSAPAPAAAHGKPRAEVLAMAPRVRIETPRLNGSIALKGGRLDDLILADYRETIKKDSKPITLLSPSGTAEPYFADFGWIAATGPDKPAVEQPVTLTWDNGEGLVFTRTYAVDGNFMFTVTQQVANKGGAPVELFPYGLISRQGTPKTSGFYILHEGLLGVNKGELRELSYDTIKDEKMVTDTGTGGWLGITDKYWLAALVPGNDKQATKRYLHRKAGGVDTYQVDYLEAPIVIAPGATAGAENHLFAGAKEVKQLDAYEANLKLDRFDLVIDWGWFYFLTRPIFYALEWIFSHVGNFGIAILILTVAIKAAFFPLANKAYESMSKMKKLQPEMMKLRERYAEDKMKLNQEMMALYKREGANPVSGCLPVLLQIPVFFALYKVLFVTIEMRHAPFYGWIHDLSAADPTNMFNLFGLIPWSPPEMLHIGVWPLLMGATMLLQHKLNPQPTDPIQAKIMMFLPILFTFLLASFPAGLVIYWTWNNLLSIAQQWVIMRRMGVKA